MILDFILLVLKQVNAAVVVIISMIRMQKCAHTVHDVPGTYSEGPLKVLMSGTTRGPSGDQQKIEDLMKKGFFRGNSLCFTHLLLFFTGKTNIQKL